jgi:hypothetical protein
MMPVTRFTGTSFAVPAQRPKLRVRSTLWQDCWPGDVSGVVPWSFLVIIDNLDIDWTGCAIGPLKADPPFIVDADTVLALPIALTCFQSVTRQSSDELE